MNFLPFKKKISIGYGGLPEPSPEVSNVKELVAYYDVLMASLVQELNANNAPPLDEKATAAFSQLRKEAEQATTADKALVVLQLFKGGAAAKGAVSTATTALQAEQYIQKTKDSYGLGTGMPTWGWALIIAVGSFGAYRMYKKSQE